MPSLRFESNPEDPGGFASSNGNVVSPKGEAAVPWEGGQVALGIILVGMAFLLMGGVAAILIRLGVSLAWSTWVTSLGMGLAILVTVLLLGQSRGRSWLGHIGIRNPRIPWIVAVLLAVAAVGLSLLFSSIYVLLVGPLGVDWLLPPEQPREMVFGGYAAIWTFQALAGWIPLTEEIFFRGFILAGLIPKLGFVAALIGSSLIFALFHVHPGVIVPIFFAGLLLGGLYYYTGSLWPPIIAHVGQNAAALTVILIQG